MNRFARLRRHQAGFTLIELLVVVGIIAMLATLMLPKVFEAINTAKRDATKGELATISGALARYYLDNGKFPTTLKPLKDQSYVKSSTTFKNKFDKWFLYAVNDDAGPTAFVLADPGNSPKTPAFTVCKATLEVNKVPEGQAFPATGTPTPIYFHSGTSTKLILEKENAAGACTAVGDQNVDEFMTIADWGAVRKDLFTE